VGVPFGRAALELSHILTVLEVELELDDEQLREQLSGLTEQIASGIEEMHGSVAEGRTKGGSRYGKSWRHTGRC
jgi:hypothetical protein